MSIEYSGGISGDIFDNNQAQVLVPKTDLLPDGHRLWGNAMGSAVSNSHVRQRLLIHVVAYQAESTLKDVLGRVPLSVLEHLDVEILVVDDSSQDETFSIGREYAAAHPEMPLTVLRNEYNQGYGGNQKIGYTYASEKGFDFVALIHGDGQYAPEELERLLEPLLHHTADAVLGSRMIRPRDALKGGMPLYKYVGNKVLTRTQNALLRQNLSEYHSGYRIYRVSALDNIHYRLNTNDFHFDTQIILQLMNSGAKIVELPIPTYYGDEISRVNGLRYALDVFRDTTSAFFHGLGLWQQRRFDPIRRNTSRYRSKLTFTSPHSLAVAATCEGSRVIDLGSGPGDIANALQAKGCAVAVVDLEKPEAVPSGIDVVVQDLNDDLLFNSDGFDTILMLDVIEHLADPEDFLDRLRDQFSHESKTLIMSTPNIAFVSQRLSLLLGQFNYGETGILDRTHTRLFTFRTLKHLLRDAGFDVTTVRGVPAPVPLVVPGRLGHVLLRVNELLIKVSKTLFAFQIFVVAESSPSVEFLVADAERGKQQIEE
jgi:glycosyltransferase involved in cell wall biosynthesis